MKYYLICVFLFAGSLIEPASGSNRPVSNSGLKTADSLFLSGQYYPAAIEYERIIFLSYNNLSNTLALLKKADCYKQINNYAEAEKILERINYIGLNDTLAAAARYQSSLCAYLAGDFANAENHLLQMDAYVKDSTLTQNTWPLYALVLNELQRWNEAKEKILKGIEKSNLSAVERDSLKRETNELYQQKNYPHLKNLLKAQKLSAFLPGLGQWYAGYFWEGAASAFLNVASAGLMAYLVLAPPHLYFSGFFSASGVFAKFYIGGWNRLEYLVPKRNYQQTRAYNNELKPFIMEIKNP